MAVSIESITVDKFTTFGDLLKYLRRRTGLTQRELSIAVGYSDAQISRLEKNERMPDVATIAARFLPVLQLRDQPALAERLLELAGAARREDAPATGLPPYKGLHFFDEGDAEYFFGRENTVSALAGCLVDGLKEDHRFLAVIGASGSGKSSLVRAGVIPALRWREPSSSWLISVITPTAHPAAALAAGLAADSLADLPGAQHPGDLSAGAPSLHETAARLCATAGASRLLLVVDQFEELFTLCRDPAEQGAFVDGLLSAADMPGGPVIVVIVLRADFYAHCARFNRLRAAISERQVYLGTMTRAELRRAIEEPARAGHWQIEPGLVDLLLVDVGADESCGPEPGALPLLSHALLETWQRRRGRTLTLSGYTASGGVRGAITETAEAVYYDHLAAPDRDIARQIFLRLTELGSEASTADTRRRVQFTELTFRDQDSTRVRDVLQTLADARLVTLSEETAEVAHEALIRAWPTLRNWLEEDREGLRLHRQLTEAAQEWDRSSRDPSGLFRGTRLARALDWAAAHPGALNDLERGFIGAAQQEAEQAAAEIEAQRQRELEAARQLADSERAHAAAQAAALRRTKRLAALLVAAVVLVGALAAAAARFGTQSARMETLSSSRLLAAAAVNSLAVDPERSVLLALEALAVADTLEARSALHQALPELHILHVLQAHAGGAVDVAFSPDGARIASIGEDRTVKIWDTATGALLATLESDNDQFSSGVAFSPDGALLAAGWETEVIIWRIATGERLHTFAGSSVGTTVGYNLNAGQVRFSPDGAFIAAANIDGLTRVWDAESGAEVLALIPDGLPAKALAFSADGRLIATGGDEGWVVIWDARTGERLSTFEIGGIIHGLSFAPGGDRLAAASEDGSARLWDARTGEELARLPRQPGMYDIAILADGRVATAGQDGVTRVYDQGGGQLILSLAGHVSTVISVAGSPDGRLVATSGYDGTVRIWDAAPGREALTIAAHDGIAWQAAFSPDGRWIGSAGVDGAVRLWDAAGGTLVRTFHGDEPAWTSLAFSHDGRFVAAGGAAGGVWVWETVTGRVLHTYLGHTNMVTGLAFSPQGERLASAAWDMTARVWDLQTVSAPVVFEGHIGGPVNIAFSPDGSEITTSGAFSVYRWDAGTGKMLFAYPETGKEIYGLALSQDGARLALGDQDGTVRILDAATGNLLESMSGHAGLVLRLSFSPDGRLLATGAFDRMARVWDAETGEQRFGLFGNTSNVFSVAFSPDGRRIVTAGADGTVRVFLADLSELVALAEARLTRTLTAEECLEYLHGECP